MRHAVINSKNEVVNVILWDGKTPWMPPEGHIVVFNPTVNIGDKYDSKSNTFIPVHKQ